MLAESETAADDLRVAEEVALVTRLTVVETVVVVSFSVGRGGFDVVALVTRLTVVVVTEEVSVF